MKPLERAIETMIMLTAPLPPKIPRDTVGVMFLIYLLENKYAANPPIEVVTMIKNTRYGMVEIEMIEISRPEILKIRGMKKLEFIRWNVRLRIPYVCSPMEFW